MIPPKQIWSKHLLDANDLGVECRNKEHPLMPSQCLRSSGSGGTAVDRKEGGRKYKREKAGESFQNEVPLEGG